jgi:hypothetical protein
MLKIFSGANGYYVARERQDGSHWQPQDNGARLGFDIWAARRELARRQAEEEEEEEEARAEAHPDA